MNKKVKLIFGRWLTFKMMIKLNKNTGVNCIRYRNQESNRMMKRIKLKSLLLKNWKKLEHKIMWGSLNYKEGQVQYKIRWLHLLINNKGIKEHHVQLLGFVSQEVHVQVRLQHFQLLKLTCNKLVIEFSLSPKLQQS